MNQRTYNDEIDLREYIDVVLRRWKSILLIAFGLTAIALIYSLMQEPAYEAKAIILMRGSSTAIPAKFAGLASVFGVNQQGMGINIDDLMKIVKSRSVAEKALEDLKLAKRIKGWDNPNIKRSSLISATSGMIKQPKVSNNIVEIAAETNDPQLSADIANGFVSALSYYWNELNYTEAQKKIKYIDSALPKVEKDLSVTEEKLKLTPRSFTGYSIAGQGGVQRDYEIYNSVYIMLRKEREAAKLEASKEIPPFSIVDYAEKPLLKSKPKTVLNIIVGLVFGVISGVFIAFFQEYWDKSSRS